MSNQRPGMFVPALIGGAVAGVLAAIPIVNCLCCLWIIGGAMLAAYLLSKDSQVALNAGDGAIVGVLTGIIAAAVEAIVSIPFEALSGEFMRNIMEKISEYAEDIPQGWERWLDSGNFEMTAALTVLGFIFSVFVFSALGALGGIIGISFFGKRTVQKPQGGSDASQDSRDRQS
jgi:hypothetical protein